MRSKSIANKIVESVEAAQPSISASMKEPVSAAVIKQVPQPLDFSDPQQLIPKSTKMCQCSASCAFKVQFETRSDLDVFLK